MSEVFEKMSKKEKEEFREASRMIYDLADRIWAWKKATAVGLEEMEEEYYKRLHAICRAVGETEELADLLFAECLWLERDLLYKD